MTKLPDTRIGVAGDPDDTHSRFTGLVYRMYHSKLEWHKDITRSGPLIVDHFRFAEI